MTASAEHSNDWRLELCDAALVLPLGALPGIGPRLVGATSAAAVQHSRAMGMPIMGEWYPTKWQRQQQQASGASPSPVRICPAA